MEQRMNKVETQPVYINNTGSSSSNSASWRPTTTKVQICKYDNVQKGDGGIDDATANQLEQALSKNKPAGLHMPTATRRLYKNKVWRLEFLNLTDAPNLEQYLRQQLTHIDVLTIDLKAHSQHNDLTIIREQHPDQQRRNRAFGKLCETVEHSTRGIMTTEPDWMRRQVVDAQNPQAPLAKMNCYGRPEFSQEYLGATGQTQREAEDLWRQVE